MNISSQAPDECAPQLSTALKQVMELVGTHLNRPIQLEMYTSQNFMGFFVAEDDANYLKRLALQYVKEISHSSNLFLYIFVVSPHIICYKHQNNKNTGKNNQF